MMYADLHVHSAYSEHPSEWFLQRIGAKESYTAVEKVYRTAKKRGMNVVTLTDHNTIEGALLLKSAHPEDTFVSVESTAYFPETGCKIHILCYDITEEAFREIDRTRQNIFALRDLLRERNIACSVAHATYAVNGRLDIESIEKLIVLFDTFEGINGTRNRACNESLVEILKTLTPERFHELASRHGIEPWGTTSWKKGFTGGSDDHAGLTIGETFTSAPGESISDLVAAIRKRRTFAGGRCGDHKSLALSIYKIAYDFSKQRSDEKNGKQAGLFHMINSVLFDEGKVGIRNWLSVQKMKWQQGSELDRIIVRFYDDILVSRFNPENDVDEQLQRLYLSISRLADAYFSLIIRSLEKDFGQGDVFRIVRGVSSLLPAAFLTAPFLSTLHHLNQNRKLLCDLKRRFQIGDATAPKRAIWFSDTVSDLNGVAVSVRNLAWAAHRANRPFSLITSLPEEEFLRLDLPPNVVNLPCILTYTPEFYPSLTIRFPSYLQSIDRIAEMNPDEIVISTPGPVGLLGLLAARLLDIPCTGIYHTDFTRQAQQMIHDEWIPSLVEYYTTGFYRFFDRVRVPTFTYIDILESRGIPRTSMQVFRRGIEAGFASNDLERQQQYRRRLGIGTRNVLMYAGRLGKEKNLDLLIRVFEKVRDSHPDTVLLIVGDGPEAESLRRIASATPESGIVLTGRVERGELPHLYAIADVFLFPSTTDTFGMAVLEAQACGVPCIVTDQGGPREIVKDTVTGFVLPSDAPDVWAMNVCGYLNMRKQHPELYRNLRGKIMAVSQGSFGWESVLDDLLGPLPRENFTATTPNVDAVHATL